MDVDSLNRSSRYQVTILARDSSLSDSFLFGLLFFTPGFLFYWLKYNRYRNASARHGHEKETKAEMKNLRQLDEKRETRKRLRNSRIAGENDTKVNGVVAQHGKEMMGEKMANYLGIGRMIDSHPRETPEGQKYQDK